MNFPSRETVERLRKTYPVGCRIVLDEMDDPYTKIPVGSQATCLGVDDAGSIMCAWDMGSSLSIAWPVDRCHKISTEAEAKTTLEWYGEHQPTVSTTFSTEKSSAENVVLLLSAGRFP